MAGSLGFSGGEWCRNVASLWHEATTTEPVKVHMFLRAEATYDPARNAVLVEIAVERPHSLEDRDHQIRGLANQLPKDYDPRDKWNAIAQGKDSCHEAHGKYFRFGDWEYANLAIPFAGDRYYLGSSAQGVRVVGLASQPSVLIRNTDACDAQDARKGDVRATTWQPEDSQGKKVPVDRSRRITLKDPWYEKLVHVVRTPTLEVDVSRVQAGADASATFWIAYDCLHYTDGWALAKVTVTWKQGDRDPGVVVSTDERVPADVAARHFPDAYKQMRGRHEYR
jgi:hypothetical protein